MTSPVLKTREALQIFLLIFLFSFIEQTIAQREVCPSWIIADNRSSTGCFSGTAVCCGEEVALLHLGNRMTYNITSDTIEHIPCPYIGQYNTVNDNLYIQ